MYTTKGRTDSPRWSTAGRRLRHIWPALRRNLIFNLRTDGHMRLLKRQADGEAAAAAESSCPAARPGWPAGRADGRMPS